MAVTVVIAELGYDVTAIAPRLRATFGPKNGSKMGGTTCTQLVHNLYTNYAHRLAFLGMFRKI